jgi:hypothetical protein
MKKLVTVKQYAALCEVTVAAILTRIKTGKIQGLQEPNKKTAPIDIDILKFPPQKAMKSGRKLLN